MYPFWQRDFDYLLRGIGDTKTFYSECLCAGELSGNSRVDNVTRFFGTYLHVEVKLNINGERDLPGQCRKWCRLDTIELGGTIGEGTACYEDHVLVIDMDGAYIYSCDTHAVSLLKSLDDIREPADVLAFRDELHQALKG